MRDPRRERIHRELFLAAFGARVGTKEPELTDRITSLMEEQTSRAGETLFAAGAPPEFYYFLREGRVGLVREGHRPWTYEGPSVFGMSDALVERPRVRTAVALTDIRAMRVQSEAWIELLEDNFALSRTAVLGSIRAVAALEQSLWMTSPPAAPRTPPVFGAAARLGVLERLAVLVDAPLLRNAGVQPLGDLAAASEVAAFAPGDLLLGSGVGGRVVLIVGGEVEATRKEPEVHWRGGPGDIVCGTAAFGDAALTWEARARTSGRALSFRTADWLDVMEEHFDVVRRTLGALSMERDELRERLLERI